MGKESQNREKLWSEPQIKEIKVKTTERGHVSSRPQGHHHGKNSIGGVDAFNVGVEFSL